MKKCLLVIMMSMIMSGLAVAPKTVVTAKADAVKLPNPNEFYGAAVRDGKTSGQTGNDESAIVYPWEYLTSNYNGADGSTQQMKEIASLDIAFFPTEEGFKADSASTYAKINHTAEGFVYSEAIASALKSAGAKPEVAYSPAFRYVVKDEKRTLYSDSDWYDVTEISHVYEFDYKLNRYELNSFGTAESGDLKYAWEILMANNPEYNYIDHMEVLVFDGEKYDNSDNAPEGAIKEVDDSVKPLTTFKVVEGDQTITKSKIEEHLTAANLKPGKYSFSARLIAKEAEEGKTQYVNSDLYPLSPAREYSPVLLSTVNMALNKNIYASAIREGDLKSIVDGNNDTRASVDSDENGQGWLIIDLGAKYYLSSMSILWETARPADYDVYIAKNIDPTSFNLDALKAMTPVDGVHGETNHGGTTTDSLELKNASGRYVILSLLKAATQWGFSPFEVKVYQNPDVPESQKFIDDWKDLRDENGNICGALNDKVALDALIKRYDALSESDKATVNATADIDGVTIQESVEYLREVLAGTRGTTEDYGITPAENPSNILAEVKDSSTIVILVAILGVIAISAYYFIEKRKLAK